MYTLGPDVGTLTVRTGKTGAAAKAGHNLLIEVTAWNASVALRDAPTIELTVDSRSLRVREGTGGIQALGDEEKEAIRETIDEEVLKGTPIAFRAAAGSFTDGELRLDGELTLSGRTRPITVSIVVGEDGRLTGSARFKQSDWGMKPYSALFGTLKVADEVEIAIDAQLPAA